MLIILDHFSTLLIEAENSEFTYMTSLVTMAIQYLHRNSGLHGFAASALTTEPMVLCCCCLVG